MPSAPRTLGSYQLLSQLAVGGMAEIYVAKTTGVEGFEKQVALKVIHPNFSADPEFVRMLVDEAKLAVQLQHANIVQIFDLGCVDGQYYIAMELIDGADLYKLLRRAAERDIVFPFEVAALIAAEVCGGLDYAHRRRDSRGQPLGIVHRDVSPQNVLVSYAGQVKIVDFGIAKATMRGQHTAAGVIKGKYYYMSPEQAWGDPIDARTDVFSAGILLYEMIVGQMLYLDDDLDRLLEKVRRADIAPPSSRRPGVPPVLEVAVMRALERRTEARFQSAGELAHELVQFIHHYAPDFSATRLSAFVRQVMGDAPSLPPVTTAPPPRDPRAATALGHGDEDAPREVLADEHSLIFHAAPRSNGRPAEPAPRRADVATHAQLRSSFDEEATIVEGGGESGDGERTRPVASPQAAPARAPALAFDFGEDTALDDENLPTLAPPPREPARADRPTRELAPTAFDEDEVSTRDDWQAGAGRAELAARDVDAEPTPTPGSSFVTLERPALNPPLPPPENVWSPTAASSFTGQPTLPQSPSFTGQPTLPPAPSPPPDTRPLVRRLTPVQWLIAGLGALALVAMALALTAGDGGLRGTVTVVSLPAGAEVRLDGTLLPRPTPLTVAEVDLHQLHRLEVSLGGYEVWQSEVKLTPLSREQRVQAVLVPTVGALELDSQPRGAEAIVNGRIRGLTPTVVGDLPPHDDVQVELRLRGYRVAHRTLSFAGERRLAVTITLEKAH